jgi:hypothetical protein
VRRSRLFILLVLSSGCPAAESGGELPFRDRAPEEPSWPLLVAVPDTENEPRFEPEPFDCSRLDPVRDPDDALRIILCVSEEERIPAGLLYGILMTESGGEVYGDRGSAGGCSVRKQYRVRDRWKPGNGTRNWNALWTLHRNIAEREGREPAWHPLTLQGSCGKSTMAARKRSFGGCIGPTQGTPVELLADPLCADKDPLDLYWSLRCAARHLRPNIDSVLRRGGSQDDARLYAINKYAGCRDAKCWKRGRYAKKAIDRWAEFERRRADGSLEAHVAGIAERKGRKWRADRGAIASNL